MFTSVHPVILAAAIGIAIALAALLLAWFVRSSVFRVMMVILAFILLVPAGYVFLAMNPWLVDSRFRTYRAFYKDIQVGMTREQVLAAMARRYPKDGPRMPPKIMDDNEHRLGFFMNPEKSVEPNCEGIFLGLRDGRVTAKTYSAD